VVLQTLKRLEKGTSTGMCGGQGRSAAGTDPSPGISERLLEERRGKSEPWDSTRLEKKEK